MILSGKKLLLVLVFSGSLFFQGAHAEENLDFTWGKAVPGSPGVDWDKLDDLQDSLAARGTKALLVIKDDRIICEWYAEDHGPEQKHYTASLAKALVGGMSLLVALSDRRMGVDDPVWKYIPSWRDDPQRSKITVRHLATHCSGIEDAETPGMTHFEQSGWKLAFWKREPDPFTVALNQAPVIFPPGTRYDYSNPGMGALAYAVTASLKGAPQEDILTLLKERIMRPIGVDDKDWSIGYGTAYELDGLKLYANWGGGAYTARAAARVGRLMLHRGNWQGRSLLDSSRVAQAVSYAGTPLPERPPGNPNPGSGLCWYTNFDKVWPYVPRDAFAGAGAENQVLLVVPCLQLVVVRNGNLLADTLIGEGFWGALENRLFNPVIEAVCPAPYPPGKVIARVTFQPVSGIVRRAEGSDNWPITWADDDHMYTSYGDGWGFEPKTERKLSQGFARIAGPGEDFRGENVRSPSGEREGDGPGGPKASGMLMVDGVLYMWVRNTANSQLAWSSDHGGTWNWGFRLTTSFGCPTFLNFGRDYQGARDNYVYIYSQDGPGAYEPYDHLVLARVPKNMIRQREAYEFFAGLQSPGAPLWSTDPDRRKPVFTYPGHCQRADAVYNPGLGRYLLALGYNHEGGWGIYDAPEPWGPWTTAFHTSYWGLGETHGYRIPSKWISADGKTMFLVFSGRMHEKTDYDAFCVRKCFLETFPKLKK